MKIAAAKPLILRRRYEKTMIGRILGDYRIIEQIGLDGMIPIYKAYHPGLDRTVTIKVLPRRLSQDPVFYSRFERQAAVMARLSHRHILPIFDYGEEDGVAYMAMRYLQAGTLTDRIKQGPLPLDEASRLLSQIAAALDHTHAHGFLHRDVKPSHILLDAQGDVLLTGFGLVQSLELDSTGVGMLVTPAYMSPEHCHDDVNLTPASDQYALGIVLYEMTTGRPPFQAETPLALMLMQLNDPLPLPRQARPDLPEEAERVILKALTKEPALRYETCGAMAAAFREAVATQTPDAAALLSDIQSASTSSPSDETILPPPPTGKKEIPARSRRRLPLWIWWLVGGLIVCTVVSRWLISTP